MSAPGVILCGLDEIIAREVGWDIPKSDEDDGGLAVNAGPSDLAPQLSPRESHVLVEGALRAL